MHVGAHTLLTAGDETEAVGGAIGRALLEGPQLPEGLNPLQAAKGAALPAEEGGRNGQVLGGGTRQVPSPEYTSTAAGSSPPLAGQLERDGGLWKGWTRVTKGKELATGLTRLISRDLYRRKHSTPPPHALPPPPPRSVTQSNR